MSACERCWAEACRQPGDTPTLYRELVRRNNCDPYEQAGPYATICEHCETRTRHQVTGECMRCHDAPSREPSIANPCTIDVPTCDPLTGGASCVGGDQ